MHKRPNPIAVIALAVVLLVPGGAAAQNSSDSIAAIMEAVNLSLAAQGESYRGVVAEYITNADGQEMGNMVIARDVGNKQLDFDFVPGDSRRVGWSGPFAGTDVITYAVDQTIDAVPPFGGLTRVQTTAAIDRAMTTWDSVNCSTLPIWKNSDRGVDIGVMASILGLGGSPFILADVQHAGWLDLNFVGGVLAATFTFGFVDGSGFTDIDNNRSFDAAFREIYYDPSFSWADDGVTNTDVETVALHEAGHGLSQAHFGKVFIDKRGNLRFAPRAVMNGVYVGSQRALLGTRRTLQ